MLIYEFVCNLICFLVLLLLVNILGHGTHIQNSHPAGGRLPLVSYYIYSRAGGTISYVLSLPRNYFYFLFFIFTSANGLASAILGVIYFLLIYYSITYIGLGK